MIRTPNTGESRGGAGTETGERASLIARLVDLQPQFRQRFEAAMPAQLCAVDNSLQEVIGATTIRQLEVLRLLATRGPLAMHEVARLHGITRSSATEVIDRLVGHGLVERRYHSLDRRSVEVALTARAEALAAQVRQAQEASIAVLTNVYDDEELATLVQLLEKMASDEPPAGVSCESAPAASCDFVPAITRT
jgi:MarR family transcriptional regulator, organic hydroperoxide resistance regulator